MTTKNKDFLDADRYIEDLEHALHEQGETIDHLYEEIYAYEKVSQNDANFNPVGGDNKEACANCQWFIGDGKCAVVRSWPQLISVAGHSDLWRAKALPEMLTGEASRKEVVFSFSAKVKARAQPMRTEDGHIFPTSAFALVMDPLDSRTWKMRLEETPGKVTIHRLSQAIADLKAEKSLEEPRRQDAVLRIKAAIQGLPDNQDDNKDLLLERLNQSLAKVKTWQLLGFLKGFALKKRPEPVIPPTQPFSIYKDKDGQYRFLTIFTNNFRDKDNPPDLIPATAHQDFLSWADKTGKYPELWLWHVPGSRIGQADWLDFDAESGMMMASGTIDKGMEDVADALDKETSLEVSHGFYFEYADKETHEIGFYRTFEISPVPQGMAANPWTSIDIIAKEAKVLTPKKREFLVAKMGEDRVKAIESDAAGMAKALSDAGIEQKDLDAVEKAAPMATVKELVEAMEKSPVLTKMTETLNGIKANADQVPSLIEANKGILKRIEQLEKSDDEKVADILTSRNRPAARAAASASDHNVADKDKVPAGPSAGNADKTKEGVPTASGDAWFKDLVTERIGK